MTKLLDAYSELFQWVLEKSYGWAIIILLVFIAIISASVTSFVFLKIIVPAKTLETVELKRDNKELSKQVEEFKKENDDLNKKMQNYKLDQAIEISVEEPDPFSES